MAESFIRFLPSEDYKHKTDIHAKKMSGEKVVLTVEHPYGKCQKALWDYNQGKKIQHAFDFFTADERNFMQTGLTSEEWDAMFEEEEEPECSECGDNHIIYQCSECGENREGKLIYQRSPANGEVWVCKTCGTETLVHPESEEEEAF